jgi:hypothetical protein
MTNGGKRLLYGTGDNSWSGGVAATASPSGDTIHVFYWGKGDNPLTALDPTPYYVNRATWTAATGWQERGE